MKKTVLIIGGAGYIGSYVNKLLLQKGYNTLIIDDLSSGLKENISQDSLFEHDFGQPAFLKSIFLKHKIDAIMHFAAFIDVGESVTNPQKYYQNNVVKTLALLDTILECGLNNLIFSSSAAIYGNPKVHKIKEDHPKNPINPYGETKLIVEKILEHYHAAYGLNSCSLRYFNAAGADPDLILKLHPSKTGHLIPILIRCVKENLSLQIFGDNYETPDGTCIRDYIHIHDLATAHIHALEYLMSNGAIRSFNLGNGEGFSVKDVIQTATQVIGKPIQTVIAPPRQGDPAILLADAALAKKELNWLPLYPDLATIINHAWQASGKTDTK